MKLYYFIFYISFSSFLFVSCEEENVRECETCETEVCTCDHHPVACEYCGSANCCDNIGTENCCCFDSE